MKTVLALVATAGFAASAFAGSVSGSGTLTMYGFDYGVTTWDIRGDAGAGTTAFGAEGMTFLDGTLYVSHDHNADRAAGRLVRYTPTATGDLSSATRIQMGNGPAGLWGPEGITINTSGSGYGSYAPGSSVRVVGLDTRGARAFGVFDTGNPGSNMLDTRASNPALDDITFAGSLNKFAGVEDGAGNTSFLRFFDRDTMLVEAASSQVIDGAKGITTVSGAFASSLTGQSVSTAQAFLVVSEFDGFAFYDANGNAIGSALQFSAYAAIRELESVAVDEANGLIFLGDEGGTAIHVVTVPAPGAVALLGLAGLFAGRRRR
jgi:hypothetical protein